MTKHLYLCHFNNRAAYVLIGWDNNRKGFYMIFDYQNGLEETAVFSNLFSKDPYPKTLDKYLDYLKDNNIIIPKEMINDLLRDSFSRSEEREITHVIHDGKYSKCDSIDYAVL